MSDFPQRLKNLRIESGLSQEELADLIGTSNTTICRYENGRQAPTKFHRARLAAVFGVPGYSLFDEDYIPNAYLPDIAIKTQEKVRHAMLTGDHEYIDDIAYRLQKTLDNDKRSVALIQIKNYLTCWSFYKQDANLKRTYDGLLSCIRLTKPDFDIDAAHKDITAGVNLSYMEVEIINFIGVILINMGIYHKASNLFRLLIMESDSDMIDSERRYCRKFSLGINLALALRKSGAGHKARELLQLYSKDAYLYGTGAVCIKLMIATCRCLEKDSELYKSEYQYINSAHRILSSMLGLRSSLKQLEAECDRGIMCL